MAKYKLGDIAPIKQGTVPKAEKYWLLNLDMVEGTTGKVIDYVYCSEEEIGNSTIGFDTENVLYSKLRPYLNKVVLPKKAGYATSEMLPMRPDPNVITREYLTYFLRSPHFVSYINEKTSGAKMPRANGTDLRAYEIECPSINEQTRITEQFDRITSIIDARKQELSSLDELIKARFVELFGDPVQNPFGWKKKRFDEICENLDSQRKPIASSDRVAGVYPYYGASGIVDYVEDYIFDEDILLVSEDGANLLMRSTPIAFSVSGKVWVNNHAHVVRFKKMCLQKYIEILFSLIDISDSITGSAQPKLNQAKLNAMEFPIPDEDRLEKYLSFLDKVDKSKVAVKKSLDEMQKLFDSFMQEYFG